MKENKLQKVTKWNKPLFMPRTEDVNLFGGGNLMDKLPTPSGIQYGNTIVTVPKKINTNGYYGLSIHNSGMNYNDGVIQDLYGSTRGMLNSFYNGSLGGPNGYYNDNNSLVQDILNAKSSEQAELNSRKTPDQIDWDKLASGIDSLFKKDDDSLKVDIPDEIDEEEVADKLNDTTKKEGFNWGKFGKKAAGLASMIPTNEIKTEDFNPFGYKGKSFKRGAWDFADPTYYLAKGRESKEGNALSDLGVSLTKTGLSSGNWWLALAGAGAKTLGSGANYVFGTKTDEDTEKAIKGNNLLLANYTSDAGSYEGLQRATPSVAYKDVYEGPDKTAEGVGRAAGFFLGLGPVTGGLLSNWLGNKSRKAREEAERKNRELRQEYEFATAWADNSYLNNLHNIQQNQLNDFLRHYSAYGGPLNQTEMDNYNDMGAAINYGFMSDYLASRKQKAESQDTMTNMFAGVSPSIFAKGGGIHINPKNKGKFNATKKRTGKTTEQLTHSKNPLTRKRAIFAQNAKKWHHALGGPIFIGSLPQQGIFGLGGDIQTNGADWSDGLVHVDAGLSHEMNPNQGVQMGIDSQAVPNLVEEGETVYKDYVFSNRIYADGGTLEAFHLPKSRKITYADLSKLLEKKSEISEKPNDPISQAGFESWMQMLMENQERQKAQEAFAALTPEEQIAIMEQANQPVQQIPEETMAQQEAMGQVSPEDTMAQQPMMADGSEAMVGEQPQIAAFGGFINNQYPDGGKLKKGLMSAIGALTDNDFYKWLKENQLLSKKKLEAIEKDPEIFDNLSDDDWKDLLKNEDFIKIISKDKPGLAAAIKSGYDFGEYNPSTSNALTFDFTNGGWGKEDYDAWKYSTDPAWKEAVEKGLVSEGMSSEEIGNALKQTDAYKQGTEALANENTRLKYLQAVLNSKDAPQAAKDYAAKYVNEEGWKEGAARDYDTIFGNVRSTHPGTYWKTPYELVRNSIAANFIINDDGTIEQITGDLPSGLTPVESYSWASPYSDNVANYYRRPTSEQSTNVPEASAGSPAVTADNLKKAIVADEKSEWPRYAGLAGPLVGLGMMQMGIGKPDYTELDAAVNMAKQAPALAGYTTLGNYLTYRPMDIWAEQNMLNAQARATDRAIANSNSPSKYAGLLASGYNSQIASGDLYKKALEYNDAKKAQVEEFNRATDQFNAQAYNNNSQFNAEVKNRARQYASSLGLQAAAQKMASNAAWYNSLYGNVGGIFKGLGDLGRENAQRNQVAELAATGVFGNIDPNNFNPNGSLRYETDEERQARLGAKGGRLRKRNKGLTL